MAGKKTTTQTLKEFQAWLEGVEELQPKGWTPDKQQWTKIRKRITNIIESEPQTMNRMPGMQRGPNMPTPGGYAPPVPSSIPPIPENIEMSPAAKALLGANPKTPDSGPDDASSFA